MESLQGGPDQFNQRRDPDRHFLFSLDLFPVCKQESGSKEKIKRDAEIAEGHMDAVRIVAQRCDSIMNWEKHVPQFRDHQIDSGYQIKPPGLAGLLLYQNRNILVKQEKHQDHRSNE